MKPKNHLKINHVWLLCSCVLAGASFAQTTVSYTSPIANYQPFADEQVKSWKEANDTVGRIGGWREYAKESSAQIAASNAQVKAIYSAEWAIKASMPERLAWLEAVSAHAQAEVAKQIQFAAQTSSELARRMRSVGNVTRMDQAKQHLMYAETSAMTLNATQKAAAAREHFFRVLGLNEEKINALLQVEVIPNALPELPAQALPESLLASVVRTVSYQRYASAAPSELRSTYAAYRHAYDLAKHHRDAILPLHSILAEEELLRYNGMFISTQDLLEQSRDQRKAVMESIKALQQFWQSEAVFQEMLQTQQRTR